MNTPTKILLAVGAVGVILLLIQAKKTVTEWADKITAKLVSFGKPTYQSGKVSIPLVIRITNPTPLFVPVQSAAIKLFFLRNGMYQPFANTPPTAPFDLKQGNTDISINPVVDVQALNPFTGGTNIVNQIASALSNQLIDIKGEVTIKIQGYSFVSDFTQQVTLKDLINAAA